MAGKTWTTAPSVQVDFVVQMLKVQSAGRGDRRRAPMTSISRVITP